MVETLEIVTATTVTATDTVVSVVTDTAPSTSVESTTSPTTLIQVTQPPTTLVEGGTSAPTLEVVDTVSQIQVLEIGAVGPEGPPGPAGPPGPPGDAVSSLKSPVFTYTGGKLTSVLYEDGSVKTLTYTGDQLSRVDLVRGSTTYRKDFAYSGQTLTSIVETVL